MEGWCWEATVLILLFSIKGGNRIVANFSARSHGESRYRYDTASSGWDDGKSIASFVNNSQCLKRATSFETGNRYCIDGMFTTPHSMIFILSLWLLDDRVLAYYATYEHTGFLNRSID